MTFTNREIRALLRQVFQDPSQSDTEYTHYEMFVNELFRQKNPNHKAIQRDLDKRPLGEESGGAKRYW